MTKKPVYVIIVVFLLFDIYYSSLQHYYMPVDGDLCPVVMPQEGKFYHKVLKDPFGLNVLVKKENYANPNRFFAHWSTSAYFKSVPFIFQKFTSPVESIYLASALAKIIIQVLLIYILSVYASGTWKIYKQSFLVAALLITPLFQTTGYNRYMGIIDQATTYTFFYALSLLLILFFLIPFLSGLWFNKYSNFTFLTRLVLFILMIVIPLHGPLGPGVILIACPMIFFAAVFKRMDHKTEKGFIERIFSSVLKLPFDFKFYLTGICIISVYSLYIGKNNLLGIESYIPIGERYSRIPEGIFYIVTQKIGFPLLFLMIALNVILIRKNFYKDEGRKILSFAKWIAVFSILYILLLPLGGYRSYRENILRYDTFLPVTLCVILIFASSSFYLIRKLDIKKSKLIYIAGILLTLIIFTIAEELDKSRIDCEKHALSVIAESENDIVKLENDCTVMTWTKITDYSQSGEYTRVMQFWNITDRLKYFYQE